MEKGWKDRMEVDKASAECDQPPDVIVVGFPVAREIMNKHLKQDDGLRLAYTANIAMRLYDRLHEMGYKPKLKPEDRDQLAEELIHLIFES